MKVYNKVRGTMATVPNLEVDIDTIYVRSNIVAINTDDFSGWEYDEIQYDKDEYIKVMRENQILIQKNSDSLSNDLSQFMDYVITNVPGLPV